MAGNETVSPKYIIQHNPLVGRCLVASEDLDLGDVVWKERPAVQGPTRDSGLLCLGCYGPIDEEDPECCDICGLPMCSDSKEQCQASLLHQDECQFFQSGLRSKTMALLDDAAFLNECILVLRVIALKNKDLETYDKVLSLEPHLEARQEDGEIQDKVAKIVQFVVQDLCVPGVGVDTVHRICGILDVNSFEVMTPSGAVQCLYSIASLAEHNCIPTIHRSFTDTYEVVLRAAHRLESGQHLSITYVDSLWPTFQRRSVLLSSKHFECMCRRCIDPTECGSHLSALKCPKCPMGSILPEDPLDSDTTWACDDCRHTVTATFAHDVFNQVNETIRLLEAGDGPSVEQCENFIKIHSGVLNARHSCMIDIKHTLLHSLGHSDGYLMADLSERYLQLKEDLARTLIGIANILLPGLSSLKATSLYELYLVYQQRGLNWQRSNDKNQSDVTTAFNTAKSTLAESIRFLKFEPGHKPEGLLLQRAEEDMAILSRFIAHMMNEEAL